MRTLIALALLLPATGLAQEAGSWHIMPGCSFVKYFPGPAYGGGYTEGGGTYKYEGSGLNFWARCFNDSLRGLALTFGAGVTWFYGPDGNSFAVKIFEFGVRYTEFSDLRNLGAYFGFRVKSFTL